VRQTAVFSVPFILGNPMAGVVDVLAIGQHRAADVRIYAIAALAGATTGTLIGQRFKSERTTRYVQAAILVIAGARLLIQ